MFVIARPARAEAIQGRNPARAALDRCGPSRPRNDEDDLAAIGSRGQSPRACLQAFGPSSGNGTLSTTR